MTGGRLKKVKKFIGDETFCFTYGDGLSNVNISDLIHFHKKTSYIGNLNSRATPRPIWGT